VTKHKIYKRCFVEKNMENIGKQYVGKHPKAVRKTAKMFDVKNQFPKESLRERFRRSEFRKILPYLVLATAGGLFTASRVPVIIDSIKLGYAKNDALVQYYQYKGERAPTKEDEGELYRIILKQNQALPNPSGPPIKNGKEISLTEYAQWYRNYKPVIGTQ
jgi:hypothetical protein